MNTLNANPEPRTDADSAATNTASADSGAHDRRKSAYSERWGVRLLALDAVPHDLRFRPVVIIDSGSGADEACLLEHWRYQLESTYRERLPRSRKHNYWLLYPDRTKSARYGSCVVDERYDKWEIRPARWAKPNYPGPFLRTIAGFEDGRYRTGTPDSPWWHNDEKKKRGSYVFPNPSASDLEFISRNTEQYKHGLNIARLWIGSIFGKGIHPRATAFADGIICYTQAGFEAARQAYDRKFYALRISWESFGHHARWDKEPRDKYAFALNWGNPNRHRLGHSAYGWPEACAWKDAASTFRPDPQADDWRTLMRAVRAENYIVLSQRETLPFDVLLAGCYGARIIAPDIPLFRSLPLKKRLLYPVHSPRHNEAVFGLVEAREYLRGLLAQPTRETQWL